MSGSTADPFLHNTTSIGDVASLLGVSVKKLRYLLFVRPEKSRYLSFTISKRRGGQRQIKAPKFELKIIQRRLADILQDQITVRIPAHGFVRGRSIVTNANLHIHHRVVFNIDLKDFFPTINFGRVRGLFMAEPFNATQEVATNLAQICCHEGTLPQGAPTSPFISNIARHGS